MRDLRFTMCALAGALAMSTAVGADTIPIVEGEAADTAVLHALPPAFHDGWLNADPTIGLGGASGSLLLMSEWAAPGDAAAQPYPEFAAPVESSDDNSAAYSWIDRLIDSRGGGPAESEWAGGNQSSSADKPLPIVPLPAPVLLGAVGLALVCVARCLLPAPVTEA